MMELLNQMDQEEDDTDDAAPSAGTIHVRSASIEEVENLLLDEQSASEVVDEPQAETHPKKRKGKGKAQTHPDFPQGL